MTKNKNLSTTKLNIMPRKSMGITDNITTSDQNVKGNQNDSNTIEVNNSYSDLINNRPKF